MVRDMVECKQMLQAERFLFDNRDIQIAIMAEAAVKTSFSTEEKPSSFCLEADAEAPAGTVRASGEGQEVHAFVAVFDAARRIDLGLVRAEASLPIRGFHERQVLREEAVARKIAELATYGVWQPALFPNEVQYLRDAPKGEHWDVWEVLPPGESQPETLPLAEEGLGLTP